MTTPTLTDLLAKLKAGRELSPIPEFEDMGDNALAIKALNAMIKTNNQTVREKLAVVETAIAQDQLLELIRTETINDRDIRPGKYTTIRNQITAKLAAALEGEK